MFPLWCSTDLARRIESAEAELIKAAAEAAQTRGAPGLTASIGGGYACFAEAGSPMNKVVGTGFAGVPAVEEWQAVERMFADLGSAVQVEVSALGDPNLGTLLTGRGYLLVGVENVLGMPLTADPVPVAGVEVGPTAADEFDTWADVVVDGFATPDTEGVPSHEDFPREIVRRAQHDMAAAGTVAYLARVDGAPAGGASMRVADGIAQLTGAATAPSYRRRGVQAALLAARLLAAREAGCDIAVVTTQPGSTSQKNVQRNGFQLLYGRSVLVGDPRG